MNILIENRNDLTFRCYPFCINSESGSNSNKDSQRNPISNYFVFHIFFKVNQKDLFDSISNFITELKNSGDQIQIIKNEPQLLKKKIKIKPEYQEKYDQTIKLNTQLRARFDFSCQQMEDLGCNCDWDPTSPALELIPDEYFDFEEYYGSGHLEIKCHEETRFYRLLLENHFLDKS